MNQDFDRRYSQAEDAVVSRGQPSLLETNKVLRQTYMLLAMTLLFSAGTAFVGMTVFNKPVNWILDLVVTFGLLFALNWQRNSVMALPLVFAFTGWIGLSLGPILNIYMQIGNGSDLIVQALGATALVFFALSAYTLRTQKDFSFMGGFLFVGLIVAVIASIANIWLQIPVLQLVIPAAFVLIASGLILFDTSRIIHGGETNYVMATVSLYLNIYILFMNLLSLLTSLSSDD